MKKHSMPEMKEGGANVTPLIDVVMCLIIFFMLVAQIGVKTGATKMELPQTIMGKKIEELGDSVILNVTDPNLVRDTGGLPTRDADGKLVKRDTHTNEPNITVRFHDDDPEPAEVPLILRPIGGGQPSFPLREGLTRAMNERKKKGLDVDKDFSVTIRAEKDLEYNMLQQVLVEVANAGVKKLNYGSVGKKNAAAAKPE